jgi:hypothetical protein
MEASPLIYFIMPVGSDPNFEHKRAILDEVLRAFGITGHFPMETSWTATASAIVSEMRTADAIVADLALERPSCYYEVGLAEGAGLEVSLIAPRGTDIHQSTRRSEVAFYDGYAEYEALVTALIQSGQGVGRPNEEMT